MKVWEDKEQVSYKLAVKEAPGSAPQRHPIAPPYRCFLSDLTGFKGHRRAGPIQALSLRILPQAPSVNIRIHRPSSRQQVVAGLFACTKDVPTLERRDEK